MLLCLCLLVATPKNESRLRLSWEKDVEWGNGGRPFGRYVAFHNVTNEANSYFKKSYSSGLFLAEMEESEETLTRFVLRLGMFCLLCFSLCRILYLLRVSVEGFITHCLFHSLALRSGCSFALCIFINKSSVFTNESSIVRGGQNILMASKLRIVIFKCLSCIFDLL